MVACVGGISARALISHAQGDRSKLHNAITVRVPCVFLGGLKFVSENLGDTSHYSDEFKREAVHPIKVQVTFDKRNSASMSNS